MNGLELGKLFQDMVDEDIIDKVNTDRGSDAFGKYRILNVYFKKALRFAVIDIDGNMIPFDCDEIEYSSRGLIEFISNNSLYLSRSIDEIENIWWN